jgi:TonB family protein
LTLADAAISSPPQDDTAYIETKQPRDTRFITSITRLTACKIPEATDFQLKPLYPPDSRKHHEDGKVIMQLVIDSDSCVRKATILQSSGYYRLDGASLGYAMNLRFQRAMLSNIKTFDVGGQLTFAFPMEWKLVASVPYVPGDPCSGGATCVDLAPPQPRVEVTGTPPEPGYIWMPGYYVHFPKTGYQWSDGQWDAPRPGYHWNAPHWDQFHSKWFFVAGIWEKDN